MDEANSGGDSFDASIPGATSPFTVEETTELRESFSWRDTEMLPEEDTEGRPTLYYVNVLIGNAEQLQFFDDIGFPMDPLPLFSEELDRWDELPDGTTIDFLGDEHGTFAFAIIPGVAYNLIREEALSAVPPFEVILLREPPSQFNTNAGWLDFDALQRIGFMWPEPGATAFDGSDEASFAGQKKFSVAGFFRRLGRFFRGVGNEIREGFGNIPKQRNFQLTLVVQERCEGIADQTRRRAAISARPTVWELAGLSSWIPPITIDIDGCSTPFLGRPLITPAGAPVAIMVGSISRVETTLGEDGTASVRIPQGLTSERVRVYLILRNAAARMGAGGVFQSRVKLRSEKYSKKDDVDIQVCDSDVEVYTLAVLTDARKFAAQVFGFAPGDAIVHINKVDIGPSGIRERTSVLALSHLTRVSGALQNALLYLIPGIAAIPGLGLIPGINNMAVLDIDFWIAGVDRNARVTLYHEYGHWFVADLFNDEATRAFEKLWTDVIIHVVRLSNASSLQFDRRAQVEALGDFFASQATGGVNYFVPDFGAFAVVDGSGTDYNVACLASGTDPCAEDNFGGPSQVTPSSHNEKALDIEVALITSTLVDFVDGSPTFTGLSSGNLWERRNPLDWNEGLVISRGLSANDENVAITGLEFTRALREWAQAVKAGDDSSIITEVARVALERHSTRDVCDLLELHVPSGGTCFDLLEDDGVLADLLPLKPLDLVVTSNLITRNLPPGALVSWRYDGAFPDRTHVYIDPFTDHAQSFEVTPRSSDPPNKHFSVQTPYTLEYDQAYVALLVNEKNGLFSEIVWQSFQSPAEIPRITGVELAGPDSVRVSWEGIGSSFRLRGADRNSGQFREVATINHNTIFPIGPSSSGTNSAVRRKITDSTGNDRVLIEFTVYASNADGDETSYGSRPYVVDLAALAEGWEGGGTR